MDIVCLCDSCKLYLLGKISLLWIYTCSRTEIIHIKQRYLITISVCCTAQILSHETVISNDDFNLLYKTEIVHNKLWYQTRNSISVWCGYFLSVQQFNSLFDIFVWCDNFFLYNTLIFWISQTGLFFCFKRNSTFQICSIHFEICIMF